MKARWTFIFLAFHLVSSCGFLSEEIFKRDASSSSKLKVEPAEITLDGSSSDASFKITGASGAKSVSFVGCSLCELLSDFTFTPPWYAASDIKLKVTDQASQEATSKIKLNPRTIEYGGSGTETTRAVEVASDGSIYVFGHTNSPTLGTATNSGGYDLYLTKFDKFGKFKWARLYGTAADEYTEAHRFVFDDSGNIIIAGITVGSFPTYTNPGGGWSGFDVVMIKVTPDGNTLWLKQYPFLHDTVVYNMARDAAGTIYISGWTKATILASAPVGDPSGYVAKYDTDGNILAIQQVGHSTGGSLPRGLAVKSDGSEIYVSGYTNGSLPGYTNAGSYDIFMVKLNSSLSILSSYQIGSSVTDVIFGSMEINSTENSLYLAGYTDGSLPTFTSLGGTDAVAIKMNISTWVPTWTKQLGTSGNDEYWAVTFDSNSNLILAGSTDGAFSGFTNAGSRDFLISKMNASDGTITSHLQWGTSSNDLYKAMVKVGSFLFLNGESASTIPYAMSPNAGGVDFIVEKRNLSLEVQ